MVDKIVSLQKKKYNINSHIHSDSSDDSVLLMANATEEKTPLLSIDIHSSVGELNSSNNDIPLQSQIPTAHCHVPDKPFDYSARNRLVIVFILCLIFMIIEIVGRFILIELNRQIKIPKRLYLFA